MLHGFILTNLRVFWKLEWNIIQDAEGIEILDVTTRRGGLMRLELEPWLIRGRAVITTRRSTLTELLNDLE